MNARSHADDESRKEFKDAIRETTARIANRGVYLRGDETHKEIVELDEALERFERAVHSRGGDLMVDEAPPGHHGVPDHPGFLLPQRVATMSVSDYVGRLAKAIDGIRKKP
jgi:hypothetical protein